MPIKLAPLRVEEGDCKLRNVLLFLTAWGRREQPGVVEPGVEHEMRVEAVGPLGRAPGASEQTVYTGSEHGAGVIGVAVKWSNHGA